MREGGDQRLRRDGMGVLGVLWTYLCVYIDI